MSTLEVLAPFSLFFIILFSQTSVSKEDDCISFTTCGNLPIRFPYRLKNLQHKNCGYRGFELSCNKKNETVIELPPSTSGKFFVRNINYMEQEMEISAPDDCVLERFLHLNLSDSPFKAKAYSDFVFFNCSKDIPVAEDPFLHVITDDCHNKPNSSYNIKAISGDSIINNLASAHFPPPDICNLMRTPSIPEFSNSYYGNGNGYVDDYGSAYSIIITWDKPAAGCRKCESHGGQCGFNSTTLDDIRCFGEHGKGTWRKNTAIGVSIGLLVFLVATLTVLRTCTQTDKDEKEKQLKIEKFLESYKDLTPSRYSYADIKRMTNKFKRQLGEGGYGSVYEGKLTNGIPVAVKVLNDSQTHGEDFINEVGTIGRIHHTNVVRLLGFCADGFRRALIYEFMPKESLEKFIFSSGKDKAPFFGWEKLQGISIGIARGIDYLHQGCDQRILHFDIKPHNILLDHKFNPKISDFGLAKLCSKGESIVSMTAARGTMGYIAPEVFSRTFGKVSYKSDVYSFGMLLLEMVGGRKNIELLVDNTSQVYFPEWIYSRLEQGEELGIEVETKEDAKIARKLATTALWCIQWNPLDRPSMKSVIQMLEENSENLIMPPNPFASSISSATFTTITGKPQQQTELTVIQEELE